jgi:hypothetical protein
MGVNIAFVALFSDMVVSSWVNICVVIIMGLMNYYSEKTDKLLFHALEKSKRS